MNILGTLEKMSKYLMIAFISMTVLILGSNVLKFNPGKIYFYVYALVTFGYLLDMFIVSGYHIIKDYRENGEETLKKVVGKFISLFAVITILSFILQRKFNILYSLLFSLIATLISYYTQRKLELKNQEYMELKKISDQGASKKKGSKKNRKKK